MTSGSSRDRLAGQREPSRHRPGAQSSVRFGQTQRFGCEERSCCAKPSTSAASPAPSAGSRAAPNRRSFVGELIHRIFPCSPNCRRCRARSPDGARNGALAHAPPETGPAKLPIKLHGGNAPPSLPPRRADAADFTPPTAGSSRRIDSSYPDPADAGTEPLEREVFHVLAVFERADDPVRLAPAPGPGLVRV